MPNESPRVTQFQETAALYAVLNEDFDKARQIISDMYPNERAEFAGQLDKLRSMLTDEFGNDVGRVRVLDDDGRFIPGSGRIV